MQVALLSFVASAEISPLSRLGGMPEALSPHTREKECGPLPDGGACHPFAQKGNLTPPWSRELTIRLVLRLCPPPLSLPHLGALVSWGAGRRGQHQRRVLGCHHSHNAPAQLDAVILDKTLAYLAELVNMGPGKGSGVRHVVGPTLDPLQRPPGQ